MIQRITTLVLFSVLLVGGFAHADNCSSRRSQAEIKRIEKQISATGKRLQAIKSRLAHGNLSRADDSLLRDQLVELTLHSSDLSLKQTELEINNLRCRNGQPLL